MDNSTLFHDCTQVDDRHASCFEGFGSESGSSNFGQSPSPSSATGVAGMQILKHSLQNLEILPDIVEVIMQSFTGILWKNFGFIKHWTTASRPLRSWEILPICLFHSFSHMEHWPRPLLGVGLRLGQVGIDTEGFSGHSTRCASTSEALLSVSTDVILANAGWTKESTFRKFYNKPVAVTNQMSLAALN